MEAAVKKIVECMAVLPGSEDVQRVQTEHRLKLIDSWGISYGSKVLEIGCGQGDTTAALAYTVGKQGSVIGLDIASPSYGSPVTLGDAAARLMQSPLGSQAEIRFECDVLSEDVDFPSGSFDFIVFSHCSWYLDSFETLEALFSKIKKWGGKLCFAEWDTRIQTIEQYPHFLAVLIQSHYECFKKDSLSNVRTLFTPMDVKRIAKSTGWTIQREETIFSPEMQDGEWEIEMTLSEYKYLQKLTEAPDKVKSLLHTEIQLLEEARNQHPIKPLSAFVFLAEQE
ncbi:SAM-dependent methyltransferase [Sporosarcina sp. NCCP-2222]|uniref:class I SAM-dependent methyltransferase n=1 Tax=Sporosarcina sp. NCCP-2222 TaxID=2935073 RepID=UPI002081EF28|nr:class I SAM-dependent methyltransferase [Sporosarcina sp. NCCP-2222]GKV56441.1 SAM-dependent methyltransferase [Sporosarcina sp. NCCP-2222]